MPSVGKVLLRGLSSDAQDVKLLHAQAEKRGCDDASQHALWRPLREIRDSRLSHHAEQWVKHKHGSASGCFDVHLTPRPDDFRAEEHRHLSVTMEHLGQMSIIHVDNACWVLLRLGRGIQPDGHEPKTVGCC